jgi:hypothetical protein
MNKVALGILFAVLAASVAYARACEAIFSRTEPSARPARMA